MNKRLKIRTTRKDNTAMKLQNLSYVIEIARCGSINKAAQNLYLSQPNLSNSMKALEREIGFSIFTRNNTGVTPTPEGVVFLESAQRILAEIDKIKHIPSLFQTYEDLSITATYSYLFMKIFLAYQRKFPVQDIRDTFKETGLKQTFIDLLEQKYRICIFYCFENRRDYHQNRAEQYNLDMTPLYEGVPVEVLISTFSPFANKKALTFEDIKNQHFIIYEDFNHEDWLGILDIPKNQQVTKIFDRSGLRETIRNSDAIAIIKKGSIDTHSDHGCLTLPIADACPKLDIYMLKQKNYQLSSRENQFIQFFKKQLALYYKL